MPDDPTNIIDDQNYEVSIDCDDCGSTITFDLYKEIFDHYCTGQINGLILKLLVIGVKEKLYFDKNLMIELLKEVLDRSPSSIVPKKGTRLIFK